MLTPDVAQTPPMARTRAGAIARPRLGLASFTILCLMMVVVAAPYLTYKPAPFTGEGSPLRQLCYVLLFGCAAAAVRVTAVPRRLLAAPLSLGLALGWCWLSLAWALDPGISIRRLILTTMIIWTIFMIVNQIGTTNTVDKLRAALTVVLVSNYVSIVVFPQFSIHQFAEVTDPNLVGAWRGFLLHKNFAGAVCAFTIITFIFDAKRISFVWRSSVIFFAVVFLYFTQSKTSLGLLFIALASGGMFSIYNPRYRIFLVPATIVLIGLCAVLAQIYWETAATALERGDALTGRAQIWPVLMEYAADHPLLGAGYGSFWNIGAYSPIFRYGHDWVTELGNGHNGYLDLLVQTGFPGLALVLFATVLSPVFKLLSSMTIDRQVGAMLLANIVFCIGHNGTETSLFDRDMIVQVFLMFTLAMIFDSTRRTFGPAPSQNAARHG